MIQPRLGTACSFCSKCSVAIHIDCFSPTKAEYGCRGQKPFFEKTPHQNPKHVPPKSPMFKGPSLGSLPPGWSEHQTQGFIFMSQTSNRRDYILAQSIYERVNMG